MARCIITFKQRYTDIHTGKLRDVNLVTVSNESDGYPSVTGELLANCLKEKKTYTINRQATYIITSLQNNFDHVAIIKPNAKNVFEDYRYEVISFEGNVSMKMFEVTGKAIMRFDGTPQEFLLEIEKNDNMWN